MIGLIGHWSSEHAAADAATSRLPAAADGGWQSFAGPLWALRLRPDATYRVDRFDEGVIVHDGRVEGWERDPGRWNGSFLAIRTDDAAGRLELFTDRLGTVPLYWGERRASRWFGSRLTDLMRQGFEDLDTTAAMQLVLLNHPLGERSLLRGIRLLPPASRLALGPGGQADHEPYWRPGAIPAGSEGGVERHLERAVALFRAAHRRLIEAAGDETIGFPVTGGLDSRCNLAVNRAHVPRAHLFHSDFTGAVERRISHRIARALGRPLAVYPAESGVREYPRFDPALETGELNAAQWWLWSAAGALRRDGCRTLVDGYLQDSLFNPHLVVPLPEAQRACLETARYRDALLDRDPGRREFVELERACMEIARDDGLGPLERGQHFALENRSRRHTFGMVRLLQNEIRVLLPGLDCELLQFGLELPWSLRSGGRLYRRLLQVLAPDLARIPVDKTGLPATSRRRASLARHFQRRFVPNLHRACDRLWPSRPVLRAPRSSLERLLATDDGFRRRMGALLDDSRWVAELFGASALNRLLLRHASGRGIHEVVCGLLTLAALERHAAGPAAQSNG